MTLSSALIQKLKQRNSLSLTLALRNALAQSRLLGPLDMQSIHLARSSLQRTVFRCSLSMAIWIQSEAERDKVTRSVFVETHCWRYFLAGRPQIGFLECIDDR